MRQQKKDSECACKHHSSNQPLDAEAVTYTLIIARASVLRRKNTCAGQTAENTEIKDEQKLIDDRYSGHFQCAYATNHNVIKQTDNIGDCILNDDGQRNRYYPMIKRAIADHHTAKTAA